MHYFRIPGIKAPKFVIGDQVIATIVDPAEGTFHDPATVTGMVWLGTHWEYFLLFDGYDYSACDWSSNELTLTAKSVNQPRFNRCNHDSAVGLVSSVTNGV
ncbi:hypothetical protein [Oscillatoria acuminata]|uniref:Uncharacterized protein n=1 Tax=Oscillatoria acuminata PCC 6304 TaxID=56110 RepID=K9TDU0_9CYAN|nr:hypothetical protein [Oscillatoria acuminata]AFY80184.1 hypothetical protein Oscil6304_0435 [Oscillatoria acuminata PCC 6304]